MPSTRSRIASGSPVEPGSGRSRRSTSALPEPETPSLSFTIASVSVGRRRRISWMAATRSSTRAQVVGPDRAPDAELLEDPPAAGLAAEVGQPRVGAVHRDAEAEGDVALEVRSCCRG